MARTLQQSPIAFPAEVARYLQVEPRDVRQMMLLDGLPYLEIPMEKRAVTRIPLRDFQGWLVRRSRNGAAELADWKNFLEDFDAVARTTRETKEKSTEKQS